MARKILVVEDNEDNRALVVKVLRRGGFEVLEATSGEEALALAVQNVPDLVLMDVDLSGMSGLEATRRMKADVRLRGVPVVALTAYAMVGDREKALEAGCDGYLSKPVDVRRLPEQVSAYLGGENRE
ncbi:MAG: response regulator [Deltaproteobacteria bacterium]|nr:response regulator [Deltaproteobacteria bacterium]